MQLSYACDAMGRRISKTVSGGTPTQFLYDGDNIVQEMQGSTINPILTGLAVDERFARNDVTGRTYFLTDALNSTIALTDTTGAIREQYSYDPYGNTTQSDTTTGFTNPYQYTGREADSPGLYYYRARYYSPVLGGMISEDPARFAGGQLSFYSYVGGEPLDRTDQSGLMADTSLCAGMSAQGCMQMAGQYVPNDAFVFASIESDTDTPLAAVGEGVYLAGYSRNDGFYDGTILAAGARLGSEDNNVSAFKGQEFLSNAQQRSIYLVEGNAGPEIPSLLGGSGGVGHFHTCDETGFYAHGSVNLFGEHVAVGFGFGNPK